MSEKTINLKLARDAVLAGTIVESKAYYKAVYNEEPDNLEAEWFYHLALIFENFNIKTADHYARLYEIFYPTLKYIATLEEGEERQGLALSMICNFPPLKNILHKALISNYDLFSEKEREYFIKKVELPKDIDKKALADDIIDIFGDSQPYGLMASEIWKELIADRFKWSQYRNFQDKGKELWFDELGAKIKKYDPSYEMPKFKQAGCISMGDAAKVKPGE